LQGTNFHKCVKRSLSVLIINLLKDKWYKK
jgi:hypothetical protein